MSARGAPAEGSLDLSPSDAPPQLPIAEVVAKLKPLLEDPAVLKVGHNLKFDIQVFGSHGIRLAPIDDTMLISYVLETGLHGHGMDELSKLHCDYTPITYDQVTGTGKSRVTFDRVPLDKATEYAAEDADVTLRLHHALKPRLVPERLTTLYETIERPLVPVIADMEACGILVDRDVLKELSGDLASRLAELETEIHRLAGHPFTSARPSSWATCCSARWDCRAARRARRAPIPPTAPRWSRWPSRATTSCRKCWTGASSPN